MPADVRLSPRFGRILTIAVGVVAAAALASAVSQGAESVLRTVAPVALLVVATWAAFWRPTVVVHADSVTVRNVFSTEEVDLADIQRIDTRFALTLDTVNGRVTAWAAPAPGRHSVITAQRSDTRHLPESTYSGGTMRPGDLVTSDSGTAAAVIRRRWEDLRDEKGGIGDGPATGRRRTVHVATIAVLAALLVAAALSLAL